MNIIPAKRPPKTRQCIDLSRKIEIINFQREYLYLTHQDISNHFNINRTTISKILAKKDKFLKLAKETHSLQRKKIKEASFPYIDDAVFQWFQFAWSKQLSITQELLSLTALKFKKEFTEIIKDQDEIKKLENFEASLGWVRNFRKRFGIKSKTLHCESGSIIIENENAAREELKQITKSYSVDDIFNADETGLFYRLMRYRILIVANDDAHGMKRDKDRISILVITNCSGNYKNKLIVIGKSKRPRCFRGLNYDILTIHYKSGPNSWMNTNIFSDFLEEFNR